MSGIEFKDPIYLLALLPAAAAVFFYFKFGFKKADPSIPVSSGRVISARKSIRARLYPYLPVLRFIAVFILIVSMARPGKGVDYSSVRTNGIDIMVAFDVSLSMLGTDFNPNRITAAKAVIKDFVVKRKTDRVGMVIFSGEPYLQSPLTIEHDLVNDLIDEVDFDSVTEDGTAIGEALTLAASRLGEGKNNGKMVLLVTDGANNRGSVDPLTAAKICKEKGIKVYAVAIGSDGPYDIVIPRGPYKGKVISMQENYDIETLKKIAEITGGKFYRATTEGVFWENIQDIDKMEKTDYDVKMYHEFSDRYESFLAVAFGLFFIEILLRAFVFRKVP